MRGLSSFLRLALASGACALLAGGAIVAASCQSSQPAPSGPLPSLTITPTILGTPAVLSQIATYSVSVYAATSEGGVTVTCTPDGGTVAPSPLLATPLATTSDAKGSGCGNHDTRCFLGLEIPQSATVDRVFVVTGYSDAAEQDPIARGCVTAPVTVGEATLPLNITMFDINPPSMCGNGELNVGETCDTPGDAGCSTTCQTVEQTLSASSMTASNPSFVWPVSGNFLGFFGETSATSSQIAMRLLSSTLGSSNALGPMAETQSIYLPNTPTGGPFPPAAEPDNQKQPAAVQIGTTTYVVFADDTKTPGTFAINLRSLDSNLNALEATACPISASAGDGGVLDSLSFPAVAVAGAGTLTKPPLYIAWQDSTGNIYGRTYAPDATGGCAPASALGAQRLISTTGPNNTSVSLAGIPTGWVAVWKSGSDIKLQAIGLGGAPAGSAATIESDGHVGSAPSVASIPSGTSVSGSNIGAFAVAWADQATSSSPPTIYAERFTNKGNSIDPATQISQSLNGTGEFTPFIAASPTSAGSYVVAWVDEGSGAMVRARFLAAQTGTLEAGDAGSAAFLPNLNRDNGEFIVSTSAGSPANPTVTVGGGPSDYNNTPFIAFGWADTVGIIARRFPTP